MSTKVIVPIEKRRAWTVPQAAAVYGISKEELHKAIRRGDLEAVRPNPDGTGWLRITKPAMDAYMSGQVI